MLRWADILWVRQRTVQGACMADVKALCGSIQPGR